MAPGKLEDSPSYYQPLPQDTDTHHHQHQQQNYIVLPIYLPAVRRYSYRRILTYTATVLLLAAALYVLWPSDPDLSVVRLRLSRFHVTAVPRISLDISLDLTVKARNRDIYSLSYNSLAVSIGYRGKKLGFIESSGGHIRGRGSSYFNATLELDGVEILSDTILLIEDLARGVIPLDTVTEVQGHLGFFFFKLPLKVYFLYSCVLYVII